MHGGAWGCMGVHWGALDALHRASWVRLGGKAGVWGYVDGRARWGFKHVTCMISKLSCGETVGTFLMIDRVCDEWWVIEWCEG